MCRDHDRIGHCDRTVRPLAPCAHAHRLPRSMWLSCVRGGRVAKAHPAVEHQIVARWWSGPNGSSWPRALQTVMCLCAVACTDLPGFAWSPTMVDIVLLIWLSSVGFIGSSLWCGWVPGRQVRARRHRARSRADRRCRIAVAASRRRRCRRRRRRYLVCGGLMSGPWWLQAPLSTAADRS